MTVSPEVQAQVDQVKTLSDVVQSVDVAMKALQAQLQTLQSQVAAVPVAQPAPAGQPAQPGLSQEDKDALTTNISDTQKLIDQLKSDITAGTPAAAVTPDAAAPATQAAAPPPPPANPNA